MRSPRRRVSAGVVELAGILAVDVAAARLVGRSSRPIRLSRVLLPEPEGPIRAANSPRSQAQVDAVQDLGFRVAAAVATCGCLPGAGRASSVEPRIATTGSSWAARRAGSRAARMPTSAGTAGRHGDQAGLDADDEHRRTVRVARQHSPQHQEGSRPAPSRAASRRSPRCRPASRKMRRICACVAPMARRMPISLLRWITDTTSTLAMPKATERAMKKRITLLDTRCEVSAVTNWALVLIQKSAVSPVSPAMRRRDVARPGRGRAAPGRCSTRRRPGRAGFAPCAGRHRRCAR